MMTDALHCPTCHVHLDQHEPGPCLRKWAVSIFGWPEHEWHNGLCSRCYRLERTAHGPCDTWQPDTRIGNAWGLIPDIGVEVVLHYSAEHGWTLVTGDQSHEAPAPLAILRAAMRARLEKA